MPCDIMPRLTLSLKLSIVVAELTEKIEIIFFSLLLHHKYFLNPRFKKGEKYVLIQKDHNILSMIKYL